MKAARLRKGMNPSPPARLSLLSLLSSLFSEKWKVGNISFFTRYLSQKEEGIAQTYLFFISKLHTVML